MPEQREQSRAYFVLGSNDEPQRRLPAAIPLLARYGRIVRVSAAYESPAHGAPSQPNYLNTALLLETELPARELLETVVPFIEEQVGPVVRDASVPRTIDVDLALYDDSVLTINGRCVPDPHLVTRAYFAVPLAEIAGDLVHPQDGRTLAEIASALDTDHVVRRTDVRLTAPRSPQV